MYEDDFEDEAEASGPPTYRVRFTAYCGMTTIDERGLELAEARSMAARVIRSRKRDETDHRYHHRVNVLEKGCEWEVEEPENAFMVPDSAGFLTLTQE